MSDLKPALPPETWAGPFPSWRTASRYDELGFDLRGGSLNVTASDKTYLDRVLKCRIADPDARHALAALALHGQPFGFTQADVDALLEDAQEWNDRSDIFAHRADRLRDLATRIQSLVNPGKTNTGLRSSAHDP